MAGLEATVGSLYFADLLICLLVMQVTSPKCVDALRAAMLSPVKCEELFYRDNGSRLLDNDDPPPQRGATIGTNNNATLLYNRVSLAVHQPTATVSMSSTAAAADKLSGTTAAMSMSSAGEKHQQHCVYCAQSFKSKGELERHVKATHVMPTSSQKCNICDEVFPSAAVLAEHKLTHCKVNVIVRVL